MTRIEKTNINYSALIILCSTLKDLQRENQFDLLIEGNQGRIVKKQKVESKNIEFKVDLNFLDTLFAAFVSGNPGPIIVVGEEEEYLRNCSYACTYYRDEKKIRIEFDHFDLFHSIHFTNIPIVNVAENLVNDICRLFRINPQMCEPFIRCEVTSDKIIELPAKQVFNEYFRTIGFIKEEGSIQVSFKSDKLAMTDSLDILFTIKDLLNARGINVSPIPEYNLFSIGQDEKVQYSFDISYGQQIEIAFKYDFIKIDIKKNCA